MCEPVRDTLSDKLRQAAVAVVAELAEPQPASGPITVAEGSATSRKGVLCDFRVIRCLSGREQLTGEPIVRVACEARPRAGTRFLLIGSGSPVWNWTEPVELTGQAAAYLDQLPHAPREPAERLAFFLPYTDSSDALVATDAYAEFARAPFADYVAIRPHLDRAWLLERIRGRETSTRKRTLYLMLLGACGTSDDASQLAESLRSREKLHRPSLHAAIACYLKLAGADGLPLIEQLFLPGEDAEWAETYSAIIAIRFCGEEFDTIPRKRLLWALRPLLLRPQYADFVIPDFARWQDWSVIEPLCTLFRELQDGGRDDRATASILTSVVQYLHACPLPEAAARLEELRRIAPQSVRDAEAMCGLNPDGTAQASTGRRGSVTAGAQARAASPSGDGLVVEGLPWEPLRLRLLLGAGALFVYLSGVAIAAALAARRSRATSGPAAGAQAGSHQDAADGLP